jgi:hypothetical protein
MKGILYIMNLNTKSKEIILIHSVYVWCYLTFSSQNCKLINITCWLKFSSTTCWLISAVFIMKSVICAHDDILLISHTSNRTRYRSTYFKNSCTNIPFFIYWKCNKEVTCRNIPFNITWSLSDFMIMRKVLAWNKLTYYNYCKITPLTYNMLQNN